MFFFIILRTLFDYLFIVLVFRTNTVTLHIQSSRMKSVRTTIHMSKLLTLKLNSRFRKGRIVSLFYILNIILPFSRRFTIRTNHPNNLFKNKNYNYFYILFINLFLSEKEIYLIS
jgi:hypothetical protein